MFRRSGDLSQAQLDIDRIAPRSGKAMPRHISRLILVILACVVVGYGAKRFFTVNSFYEYGHYRGDSVAEIASDKPKFKGVGYCASCHAKQIAEWSNGVHNSADIGKIVRCEVCHGAGGERDVRDPFRASATGADHPNNLKLVVPTDTRKLCTLCHERLTGRPLQQRQIVVADHAGTQQCITCHNPHSPKLNLTPVEATAPAGDPVVGKAKAAACAGCHGVEGVSKNLPGPSLAGQNAAYFTEALKAYGTGGRNNPMMSPAVQAMNAEDAGNLAAYFSGLKCEAAPASDAQAASAGQAIISRCTACHGADGRASNGAWPNLAGQSRDYLINAIKAYKGGGARNNSMMAGVVKVLSDADAESVATYYASATCK
jgi:cytochrome c553